jgi:hypothetical protein
MSGLFIIVCSFLAVIAIVHIVGKRNSLEKQKRNREEAYRFFADIKERKQVPITRVDVVLKDGELGVFQESTVLLETRAYRVFGGGGTRVGGIYIGGGASESHQRLKEIDSGILVLSNRRLIFDGRHENRSINLSDVISANAWLDAVEVSSSRRQKSQIYRVRNPIIWTQMIQMLASGEIERAADGELVESASTGEHSELDPQQTKGAPMVPGIHTHSMRSDISALVGTLDEKSARSIGNRVGREIMRGILSSLSKSPKR